MFTRTLYCKRKQCVCTQRGLVAFTINICDKNELFFGNSNSFNRMATGGSECFCSSLAGIPAILGTRIVLQGVYCVLRC